MRVYRRGRHTPVKASLTVDNVLCKVLRSPHFTADKEHLCLHRVTIMVPTDPDPVPGCVVLVKLP